MSVWGTRSHGYGPVLARQVPSEIGLRPNRRFAHQACLSPTPAAGRSIALMGSIVSAVFTTHRALQLADHAVEEPHTVVDSEGLELQDVLR